MRSRAFRNSPDAAFTLLEVMLSVSIFILLAGGIFSAVSVSTKASADVALARLETERLDALRGFLRQLFSNLPREARMELRMRGEQELLIFTVPEFAVFSRDARPSGGLSLWAQPQEGGLALTLANFDERASVENRNDQLRTASWIMAFPDIEKIRWRFAAKDTVGLSETWEANNGRPLLVDLEMTLRGGYEKHWQFYLPDMLLEGASL